MKIDPKVFLRAADVIMKGDTQFYGLALDKAGQPNPGGHNSPMQDWFNHEFKEAYRDWHNSYSDRSEHINTIVLALCLAAAIAADPANR